MMFERPVYDPFGITTSTVEDISSRSNKQSAASDSILRSADQLETQLRRSKNANLSVTIRTDPASAHDMRMHDIGQPYLRILLPHLHRASYPKAPCHVLANIHLLSPLGRLREIDIGYCIQDRPLLEERGPVQHILHQSNTVLFSALVPNGLVTNGSRFYKADLLTPLIVDSPETWTHLRSLLSQLQNLTHLQLRHGQSESIMTDGIGWMSALSEDESWYEDHCVPLPKLLKLSVQNRMFTSRSEVFSHILAPKLQHLSCLIPSDRLSILQFLAESGCKPQPLCVQSNSDVESLLNFLSNHWHDAFDTVDSLEIHHRGLINRYYARLNNSDCPDEEWTQENEAACLLKFFG